MFDSDGKLIVRNNRYLEIFGMPPGSIEPGCSLIDILNRLATTDVVSAEDPEQYASNLHAALAENKTTVTARHLSDGRIIEILSRPMPGGGWVATHEASQTSA